MDCPVLIIGAGPSGATLALHLGLQGVKSIVLSRHKYTANTPRAHIFNQRAMEVLRDAGLDDRLSQVASSAKYMQHTSWLHSLAGEEYGRLWAWGNKPEQKGDYERASPCVMSDLPQSVLEPILVEESRKLGADFRFYTEYISFQDKGDHVETTIRDRASGLESVVVSSYMIGADGARSMVLDQLGIQIDGKQLNTAFNVHIRTEMSKYFAHRPGSLNWILNPDAPDWSAVGNFRMVKPWSEFVVSMHPQSKDGKIFEPSEVDLKKRLHQMIGDDSVPIEILSSFRWTINDQVAREWSKGRVYCIGDATHRHPPINGLGSNTCLSDAFNLGWKIAMVLKGFAAPALLETLTSERKPVGDAIVKRANAGMEAHRRLWNLMGFTPEARESIMSTLKSNTPEGAKLRQQLREGLEATDDEVQALGIQMNQTYLGSPATLVEADDAAPDFTRVNFIKDLMISTYPGYHLPHVWLASNGQAERISILDLCGHGKFALFTGIGGNDWCKAANAITLRGGIQIEAYTIGYGCDYMDTYRDWFKVRSVDEDGVVLVRPDHFVAWRCRSMVGSPEQKLDSVLRAILGWHTKQNGHV